jgi:hypothetical protein
VLVLLKKNAEKFKEHTTTKNLVREGCVLVIPMPGKKVCDAVPVGVFLRKNFQNSIPVCSNTKIPLAVLQFLPATMQQVCHCFTVLSTMLWGWW